MISAPNSKTRQSGAKCKQSAVATLLILTLTMSSHKFCCVPKCSGNGKLEPNLSFHTFQKDKLLRAKWIQAIRRDPGPYFRVSRGGKIGSYLLFDFLSVDCSYE